MQIFHSSKEFRPSKKPIVAALGNFDGVHLGHQAILAKMVSAAKAGTAWAGVYTFEPHPAKILAPSSPPLLIQTVAQKLDCLESLKLDWVVLEPFDGDFAKKSPEDFFDKILLSRLQAKELWVGTDFTFGFRRSGTVSDLQKLCQEHEVSLHITQPQFKQDTLISSSRIREMILQGNVHDAQTLLGKPFALMGSVIKGAGLGTKLGIHTANLAEENELIPKVGIYITTTRIQGKNFSSVTSVGTNPTFPGKGFSIETHILDFDQSIVGKKIEVLFLKWLREEKVFTSSASLVVAIRQDIDAARKYHEV